MTTESDRTQVPIESVNVGDAVIQTVFERDHAWPVMRKACEGDSKAGSVYALFKHANDRAPAIREPEGTLISIIRRPA